MDSLFASGKDKLFSAFTPGIGREPSFFHALFLFEEFQDRPEAGECSHAGEAGQDYISGKERAQGEKHPANRECPPSLFAEIVFSLDYYGMEYSDYEEGCKTDDDTCVIHIYSICPGKVKK